MKPKAFSQQVKAGKLESGYLFVGPELFFRDRCRKVLRDAVLGDAGDGFVDIDLKEKSIADLLDETRSLSLFATSRLIIGSNAEQALPKGRSKQSDDDKAALAAYFGNPTPGVVVAFESTRLDPGERDDKARIDRLLKLFSAVPVTVEMDRLGAHDAVRAAVALAKQRNLDIEQDVLAELVDMLGGDLARLDNELEKLALFAEPGRPVTQAEIETLVPEARQSGVFELSDALGRRDRTRALGILDRLAKAGVYWPMQLTMLAGLFRQALAVREMGGRNPQQVSAQLSQYGSRVWPSRARQLIEIAGLFRREQLERAIVALHQTDCDLRRERPEDRIIMERLVLELTEGAA